jgi:hypothetical protein
MGEQPHLLGKAWEQVGVPTVLAGGAAVLAWANRKLKRRAKRAARQAELLEAVAEWAQVSIEEAGWRDWLTATNRLHPLSDAEASEQRGAYRQRRKDAADRLRAVLQNERRGEPRQPQDMFAPADITDEERSR